MCKCIGNIIKSQLKDGQQRGTGRKVTSFEFTEDACGNFVNMATGKHKGYKTKSTVRYTLDGLKKVHRSYMQHNFCPFCGKEYK